MCLPYKLLEIAFGIFPTYNIQNSNSGQNQDQVDGEKLFHTSAKRLQKS